METWMWQQTVSDSHLREPIWSCSCGRIVPWLHELCWCIWQSKSSDR